MTAAAPRAVSFTRFAELTGLRLERGQAAFAAVAFDGLDPADLDGEQRETARAIFGDVERVPVAARAVIVQAKGRDVGGSRSGAVRAVHLAATHPLDRLDPSEPAFALFVAPKVRLARIPVRFALEAAKRIGLTIESETTDGFTIVRHDGRRVVFEAIAASRGGDTGRGVPILIAVLDEAAFFRDETSGIVNDRAVFNAIVPRLLGGGQILIVSSPWAESGLLFEEFTRNHGKPETACAAFCPTLVMRDDPDVRANVEREMIRDPANADLEYGVQFRGNDATAFIDARAVKIATIESLPQPLPPPVEHTDDEPEQLYAVGADFAFRRNSSACVVIKRDADDVYTVAAVEEQIPTDGPLKPSAVCKSFAALAKRYGATELMADDHYRESVVEHLETDGLFLMPAPGGATGKAESYVLARSLILENRVRLPNHERLLKQIREVVSRPLAGGGISVESPTWKSGAHGDLVSALVLALWHASRQPKPERRPAPRTDLDRARADMERRKAKLIERALRAKDPDCDDWILGPG